MNRLILVLASIAHLQFSGEHHRPYETGESMSPTAMRTSVVPARA
jgi:hypothetical protein